MTFLSINLGLSGRSRIEIHGDMEKSPEYLNGIEWKRRYSFEVGEPVLDFYVPALSRSVRYDRKAGFFSSTALAVAAQGVAQLIGNDGRMRLTEDSTLRDKAQSEIGTVWWKRFHRALSSTHTRSQLHSLSEKQSAYLSKGGVSARINPN